DYVDGRSGTPSYAVGSTGYRMLLSREGWLQPWTRLRANEADERRRLEDMPAFRTINETSGIKPGAAVLAEAIDHAGNSLPALVTQRYGHGRTAALTIGDLWRWQLKQPEGSDDAGKAWRQALRWLVADVPEPVTIEVRPAADTSSETVLLRVKALDRSFQPLDNASVSLTVHPPAPGGQPLTLHAEPSLDEPGVFEAAYVPREPGACRVLATVTDENGQAAGTAETGWVSNPTADEFRSVTPDRAFVERLARETGGQLVEPHDLGRFVASLSTRDAPVTERWTYPLWHQAWVFIVAVACLAGEWGLRRAKGMP
ncbi:MAG TPA: hypothetical protein VML55_18930, partial [Planctomycetaceae bacterium]|nr:hypothetical protein [Planctomycetaceae bacterium]